MRIWLSGEGPSDLGAMRPALAGHEFLPGPMAVMVDHVTQARVGFSFLDTHQAGGDCVRYVSNTELAQAGKQGPLLLPGVRFGKHNSFFTKNSQVLALMAKRDTATSGQPTVAVLFRDGDGTQSMPKSQWEEKFDSIKRGFKLVDYACGVPMVPRPKSEAWLLCAIRPPAYEHCAHLEEASGNDNSPNDLKSQLAALMGLAGAQAQAQWVLDGHVDIGRIDMPSFNAFRSELDRALTEALAA